MRSMRRCILAITLLCVLLSASAVYADDLLDDVGEFFGEVLRGIVWGLFDFYLVGRINAAIDYWNPDTRSFLLPLVDRRHGGYYNIAQACDIWDYCRAHWVYISDPYPLLFDSFAAASETIAAKLRGDCDDFAILLATAVRLIGGTAMVIAEKTEEGGHAYTLVYLGSDRNLVVMNVVYIMLRYGLTMDNSGKDFFIIEYPEWGCWLSLDWQADYPGGPFWAKRGSVTDSHYLPTPSILLATPIFLPPEISYAKLQALLGNL